MTRRVRFVRAAIAEVAAAADWYEEQDVGIAEEFRRALRASVERIAERPDDSAPLPGAPQARRLLMGRFPFAIIFVTTEADVVVLAIAHQRRKPDYWKTRLGRSNQ